jgi:hypothetical protein
MAQTRTLPSCWLLRRFRRWLIRPQKEIARMKRRWQALPFFALPRFLRECRQLLDLLLWLHPDLVLGNARSGSPYVAAIEQRLKEAGMEVRYERLCSAWGHRLQFALKPAASLHWCHLALVRRRRIVMVDVSRKPFSDAQRIVGGVIVWLYNEAVSHLTGEPQPPELVPALNKQMRDYLRRLSHFQDALQEVIALLQPLAADRSIPFACHLLVRRWDDFEWDKERGCLLAINASRTAWIDDRTDKYAWLPAIARWFL